MKKSFKLLCLMLVVFMMTGCMKYEWKMSINKDKLTVPMIDFTKNVFPIFNIDIKNNGIFIINIVIPIGKFNK